MLRYNNAVMTFKCLKGLAPPYLLRRFSFRSETLSHDRHGHLCHTRRKDELDVPLYRTAAVGQRDTGRQNYMEQSTEGQKRHFYSPQIFKVQKKAFV